MKEDGEKQLSVYVIHSLPTLMSVVQLYVEDKMVMVCHLVSADTIGYEKALGLDNQVWIEFTMNCIKIIDVSGILFRAGNVGQTVEGAQGHTNTTLTLTLFS